MTDSKPKKPKKTAVEKGVDKAVKLAETIERNRATELEKFHERFDVRHRDMRAACSVAVLEGLNETHPWRDPLTVAPPPET